MNIDVTRVIIEAVVPVLSAVAGYFTGRGKRKNDFLAELQKSIDLLSAKNTDLMKRVVELNDTVVSLRRENGELKNEVAELRRENERLSDEVNKLNEQLQGVKTITRVRKADS
jgi:predicted RNase H-like nuclease (RuvC/YqgF family)